MTRKRKIEASKKNGQDWKRKAKGITMYYDIHPNTIWLMSWADRMAAKYGNPPGEDWCRKLAYYVGEAGNDYPSDEALQVAHAWEIDNK